MKTLAQFLKTTLIGGVVFLLPAALIFVVLRHALDLAEKVASPLAALMPERLFGGIGVAAVLAVLLLLLIALAAGLIAQSPSGRQISRWFEESLLGGVPQYRMLKSMAQSLIQLETGPGMQPVLFRGDEGRQLAYRLEDLHGGWVAIFLPQAPTPMSGNILYVRAEKIQVLDMSMADAMRLVKSVGIGSATALRHVDLET